MPALAEASISCARKNSLLLVHRNDHNSSSLNQPIQIVLNFWRTTLHEHNTGFYQAHR